MSDNEIDVREATSDKWGEPGLPLKEKICRASFEKYSTSISSKAHLSFLNRT